MAYVSAPRRRSGGTRSCAVGRTAPGRQCENGRYSSCIPMTIHCRYTGWAIL